MISILPLSGRIGLLKINSSGRIGRFYMPLTV
jgi:hypothetical protein